MEKRPVIMVDLSRYSGRVGKNLSRIYRFVEGGAGVYYPVDSEHGIFSYVLAGKRGREQEIGTIMREFGDAPVEIHVSGPDAETAGKRLGIVMESLRNNPGKNGQTRVIMYTRPIFQKGLDQAFSLLGEGKSHDVGFEDYLRMTEAIQSGKGLASEYRNAIITKDRKAADRDTFLMLASGFGRSELQDAARIIMEGGYRAGASFDVRTDIREITGIEGDDTLTDHTRFMPGKYGDAMLLIEDPSDSRTDDMFIKSDEIRENFRGTLEIGLKPSPGRERLYYGMFDGFDSVVLPPDRINVTRERGAPSVEMAELSVA